MTELSAKFASAPAQTPDYDLVAAIGLSPELAPVAAVAIGIALIKAIF